MVHISQSYSRKFLRHSGNTIEAIGNSEKILRETRMPAVAIRYGSTEDLITDSQMLLKVLTEAISSWFSEPFEKITYSYHIFYVFPVDSVFYGKSQVFPNWG